MYFNARFFVKDLRKTTTKRYADNYLKTTNWWIKCHSKPVDKYGRITPNTVNNLLENYESNKSWESKTKPAPLSLAEIKKLRGEN